MILQLEELCSLIRLGNFACGKMSLNETLSYPNNNNNNSSNDRCRIEKMIHEKVHMMLIESTPIKLDTCDFFFWFSTESYALNSLCTPMYKVSFKKQICALDRRQWLCNISDKGCQIQWNSSLLGGGVKCELLNDINLNLIWL